MTQPGHTVWHQKEFKTYSPQMICPPVFTTWILLPLFQGDSDVLHSIVKHALLLFHERILCLCSGFRGSHYSCPCPPTYHMKTSLVNLRLTTLFMRQRWVNTCQTVKWLAYVCICVIVVFCLLHYSGAPGSLSISVSHVYPIASFPQAQHHWTIGLRPERFETFQPCQILGQKCVVGPY